MGASMFTPVVFCLVLEAVGCTKISNGSSKSVSSFHRSSSNGPDCLEVPKAWQVPQGKVVLSHDSALVSGPAAAIDDVGPRAWEGLPGQCDFPGVCRGRMADLVKFRPCIRTLLAALEIPEAYCVSAFRCGLRSHDIGEKAQIITTKEALEAREFEEAVEQVLKKVLRCRGFAERGICTNDFSSGLAQQRYTECSLADSEKNYFNYEERVTHPLTRELMDTEERRVGDVSTRDQSTPDGAVDKKGADHTSALSESIRSEDVSGVGDQTTRPGVLRPLSQSPLHLCLDLEVQGMTVMHPKEGAVYWKSPVQVELEVTLAGPGLEGLDIQHIHACADLEYSWPTLDRSRSCVTLKDLSSPEAPRLVFGSGIGVMVGSVGIWDARPPCIPPGSSRGDLLPMGRDRSKTVASQRFRFKIIHHESTLRRRGRPFGPAPLGRGFSRVRDFIHDLEREAQADYGPAFLEMESYRSISQDGKLKLRHDMCTSRLNIHDRGSALIANGTLVQFVIEQLEWMISNAKLPEGLRMVADRMRQLQMAFVREWVVDPLEVFLLLDNWLTVAPFLNKALMLPAPASRRVISTSPLYTWEYDEVPWMEALNPEVDWKAVEETYLRNEPVQLAYVDNFFSETALAVLLDMARSSTIYFETRANNYIGAYPGDGMSHPLLYQIAEEAAQRLPRPAGLEQKINRVLGQGTTGWPLVQMWFYIYGGNNGNNGEMPTKGIKAHADNAVVNFNVWLTPDSANLGSMETHDGGGLTVFHAKAPDEWKFSQYNGQEDTKGIDEFLQKADAGNTSIEYRQNRALLFDSMLFHQSDPLRFKKGFENKRINLTLLFGKNNRGSSSAATTERDTNKVAPTTETLELGVGIIRPETLSLREISPEEARHLRICL